MGKNNNDFVLCPCIAVFSFFFLYLLLPGSKPAYVISVVHNGVLFPCSRWKLFGKMFDKRIKTPTAIGTLRFRGS